MTKPDMRIPAASSSLMLLPDDHRWAPDKTDTTIQTLSETGLIEKAISGRANAFYTGDKFLDLIAFVGCSPALQFRPTAANPDFCYIHLHTLTEPTLIHSLKQARAPQCPRCQKPVKNWQDSYHEHHSHLACDYCGKHSDIETFNWRKSAGIASFFIEITSVFPREAIPQSALIKSLEKIHCGNWTYFYYCA